jgi:hypothetical protein
MQFPRLGPHHITTRSSTVASTKWRQARQAIDAAQLDDISMVCARRHACNSQAMDQPRGIQTSGTEYRQYGLFGHRASLLRFSPQALGKLLYSARSRLPTCCVEFRAFKQSSPKALHPDAHRKAVILIADEVGRGTLEGSRWQVSNSKYPWLQGFPRFTRGLVNCIARQAHRPYHAPS